jgi:opacity protein-like surface antigen
MPFSALLVVLSAFPAPAFVQSPALDVRPADAAITAAANEEEPAQRPGGTGMTDPRPHRVGLGGSLGISNRGGGGALRYWFGSRVGVDFTAGYHRANAGSTIRTSVYHVSPSVIVLLTDADPTRDIDVRPYVGAGVGYVRATSSLNTSTPTTSRASATGWQAFGGVEMTFQEHQNLAISTELGYYRQPVRFAGVPDTDGFDVRVYVHFYLR